MNDFNKYTTDNLKIKNKAISKSTGVQILSFDISMKEAIDNKILLGKKLYTTDDENDLLSFKITSIKYNKDRAKVEACRLSMIDKETYKRIKNKNKED